METPTTAGKVNIKGNMVVREKPKKADYVLYLSDNNPIAVVAAKDNIHSVSFSMLQGITDGLVSAAAPIDPNLFILHFVHSGTLSKVPKAADLVKKTLPTDVLSTDKLPTDVLPTTTLPTDTLPAVPKL